MMHRPLLLLLAAFISGIIAGKLSLLDNPAAQIFLFLVFIFLFVANRKGDKTVVILFIVAAFFLLGCLDMNLYYHREPGPEHIVHHLRKEKQIIDGVICEQPQVSPYKNELVVSVSRILVDTSVIAVQGRVMLSVKDNYPFKYGDAVRCKVRLKRPHNFQNPGGFDYETHLRFRQILVQGFISEGSDIVVLRENQGNPFRTAIERYRRHLKDIIRSNAPSPQGEIIQAMILGDQKEIPDDIREQFNRTGTSHIIAISGFNVGIIAAFSFFIIRLLLKSSENLLLRFNIIKISTLLTFFPITFFVFIAGMGASVVRAAIMVLVFMISILLGKQRDLYNALALSALVILLVDPPSLFDVSFQLSFSAVAAILFITPKLSALLPQINSEGPSGIRLFFHRAAHNIFLFIAASTGAILGTLPLISLYFNRLSIIALPANLFIAPLLGMVALPVSMAIILTDLFSRTLTVYFVRLSSLLVEISLISVRFFDSLPFATFRITTPTAIEIMAYYLMIALAVILLDRATALTTAEARQKTGPANIYLWIGLSATFLFFLVDGFYLHLRDQDRIHLKITAIDVGQGSATLVQFPGGRKMLIDGGGFPNSTFDVGRYVLAPFLWHERIDHIDTVVLSHPHPDHMNGLIFILENFKVREVWTNGEATGDPSYIAFSNIIRKRRLICRSMSEQEGTIHLNPLRIAVLNPERPLTGTVGFSARSNAVNDNSLVLKLSYGNVRFLIPGDITGLVESRLLAKGTDLSTDVLIVAHHGGFTSSTESFLKALTPMAAVISCGADNIYGYPHPDVLKRLNRLKAGIFRTDRDGAITLSTDGRKLVVHPYGGVPEQIFSRDRVSILAP